MCPCVKAQTIAVSGWQTGVWDADTVWVTGDVQVQDSLVVNAGTLVLFEKFYGITVSSGATFSALGEPGDSIVFTVADTAGFYIYNQGIGGWNGFMLDKAGKVKFDYCVLQYGKAADTLDRFGGVLHIYGCSEVDINHSTLRCNFSREFGGAVYAEDSEVRFADCCINENKVYTGDNTYAMYGGGAAFLRCEVVMERMEFSDNYGPTCIGGALSLDSCSLILDRSVFHNNIGINGGGMYLIRSNHKECRMSNLLFDDNFSGHFGGGFALADASPEVYNVLVTNNKSEGVACNGVFFYGHSSPLMNNCIIYGNYPPDGYSQIDTAQMWVWTMDDYAPEFRNCVVEGGLNYIHSAYNIQVFEDIIDADPRFVDAANHDFHLAEDSPCRDAGWMETPDYITQGVDLDGMPRCMNYRIDIGPYEFLTASIPQREHQNAFACLSGNPLSAESRLLLETDGEEMVTVTVYALTGRECSSIKFNAHVGHNECRLGALVEGLAPGVYLIEVSTKDNTFTLKAVK